MGLIPKPTLFCSMCKRQALVAKIRTPAGRVVTAIFCLNCDDGQGFNR